MDTLESIREPETPFLCEIWNWEGDTSILHFKFESVLNEASDGSSSFDCNALKAKYVKDPRFDPMGFFFLTYRSSPIGLALAFTSEIDGIYEVPFLVATPSHRNKGVEACLLGLILKYCK